MKNLRKVFVIAALAAVTFSFSGGGSAGAACALDAQIAGQQAVIAELQAQLPGADARTAAVLNAQITARQAVVADLQAACSV